jgi:hypothetical protein
LFIFLFNFIDSKYFFHEHFKSFSEAFFDIFKGLLKEKEFSSKSKIQKLAFHSLGGIK